MTGYDEEAKDKAGRQARPRLNPTSRWKNKKKENNVKNIGPVSSRWLAEVGIYTITDLKNAGSIATYRILKERYPKKVSLNLLWGLEAAVRDVDWRELTDNEKVKLKKKL